MPVERERVKKIHEAFERSASSLEARLKLNLKVQQDWLDRIAAAARNFTQLQGEAAVKLAEKALRGEAAALLGSPQQDRERRMHLASFRILTGEIPGIGPKRVAELAGHGITTAADLVPHRIAGIPGFGEALTEGLIEWRKSKEKGFRPSQVNAAAGAVEHRARQLLAERKKEFTQRWGVLDQEIRRLIEGANACAGEAVKIQKELDAMRANATAAAQVLARLGGP
jgi:DNA-binding helix-hairpin-helix protein with protein kinase domain